MFFFFSKTLNYLLTPAGWLVALLLWAFFTRKPHRRRWGVGLAICLFWLLGNSLLTNELARYWEFPPSALPGVDSTRSVAVVLTGGTTNSHIDMLDGHPSLGPESDRLAQALYLYKRGVVRKILISGGSGSLPLGPAPVTDEGHEGGRFLILAGVRPADIWLENNSRNTRQNALFTKQVLRRQFQTNRCVLVTSASHMRRAVKCFQKVGVDVLPYPGGFRQAPRSLAVAEWLFPNETAFLDAYHLIREIVGYVVYRVVGYVE
ncbi:YdcF family protein [uncultured Spirosoma sp.]|uniref:YdcF family protein n=1 Tax=uncultured Spirosoma sp. TaxID=278208 RepID=UPI00258831AC|nr:YdcF family protein [uncultured Spirosoma sp.]